MRTTLIIPDMLIQKAMEETGIKEKTKLVQLGLEALIKEKSRERLANLFGSAKGAKVPRRKRK